MTPSVLTHFWLSKNETFWMKVKQQSSQSVSLAVRFIRNQSNRHFTTLEQKKSTAQKAELFKTLQGLKAGVRLSCLRAYMQLFLFFFFFFLVAEYLFGIEINYEKV